MIQIKNLVLKDQCIQGSGLKSEMIGSIIEEKLREAKPGSTNVLINREVFCGGDDTYHAKNTLQEIEFPQLEEKPSDGYTVARPFKWVYSQLTNLSTEFKT